MILPCGSSLFTCLHKSREMWIPVNGVTRHSDFRKIQRLLQQQLKYSVSERPTWAGTSSFCSHVFVLAWRGTFSERTDSCSVGNAFGRLPFHVPQRQMGHWMVVSKTAPDVHWKAVLEVACCGLVRIFWRNNNACFISWLFHFSYIGPQQKQKFVTSRYFYAVQRKKSRAV